MSKLITKIIFIPNGQIRRVELIGEIDKNQLYSPECGWINIESKYFEQNEIICHQNLIYKADIIQVLVLKETKRYVIDKETFALNAHLKKFVKIEG